MKRIEKKVHSEYFDQIIQGRKTFELRLQDFDIKEGDTFLLREWDKDKKEYTGRQVEKKVGYVGKWKVDDLTVFWPKEDIEEKGIQIISLL